MQSDFLSYVDKTLTCFFYVSDLSTPEPPKTPPSALNDSFEGTENPEDKPKKRKKSAAGKPKKRRKKDGNEGGEGGTKKKKRRKRDSENDGDEEHGKKRKSAFERRNIR